MHIPTLSTAYFPPVSWLAVWWNHDTIRLEAQEHFQKGSYRNRCHIAGPNGPQRLSIPLEKGKHQQLPIREVRIAYDEPWQRQHWRSIVTAYGSAPFFEHYAPELEPFFEKRYNFLFDLNLDILNFITKKFSWNGQFTFSDAFEAEIPGDFRMLISPKPAVREQSWFRPVPYAQVFAERHGFLPDLSALDLLFCRGPQGGEILRDSFVRN